MTANDKVAQLEKKLREERNLRDVQVMRATLLAAGLQQLRDQNERIQRLVSESDGHLTVPLLKALSDLDWMARSDAPD